MSHKKKVVIFGAGKIGSLIANFLVNTDDYLVTLADAQEENLAAVQQKISSKNIQYTVCHFEKESDVKKILKDKHYCLSSAPFFCNKLIAKISFQLGIHYLDLTEDIETTNYIQEISKNASSALIPQCGLAPGFITIVTNHLISKFTQVHDVKMRVGALPRYPHNRLKYNLTWSTDGLINEYCQECDVLIARQLKKVQPLEDVETLLIEGEEYEAFNTSGGLGTLVKSLAGQVENMNYKSIRYPGHREILLTLLHDLQFKNDRETLRHVFERSLPYTLQDMIIVYVTVSGQKEHRFVQESYVKKIYGCSLYEQDWGAIQVTTAAGICSVLDLHAQGHLPLGGFIKQEQVPFNKFIQSRFGRLFK